MHHHLKDDAGKDHAPKLDEASRFLRLLDPLASGFTFQTVDDNRERDDDHLRRVRHGPLEKHADCLIKLNRQEAGIFVTINETTLRDRRTRENIVRVRAVFLDLDGSPLEPVMRHHIKPQIVVETSPGKFHCYYRTTELPLDQFYSVQKALAARYDGDGAVCDLPRVMRLPGFYHRKREPFQVRIIASSDTPPYPHTIFERRPAERHFSGEKGPASDHDVLLVIAALRVIPPTLNWQHRNYIGMAAWRATDGALEGFEAWCAWLSKSGRFDERHAIRQWRKYFKSPATRLGIGTLIMLANTSDPEWRDWLLDWRSAS